MTTTTLCVYVAHRYKTKPLLLLQRLYEAQCKAFSSHTRDTAVSVYYYYYFNTDRASRRQHAVQRMRITACKYRTWFSAQILNNAPLEIEEREIEKTKCTCEAHAEFVSSTRKWPSLASSQTYHIFVNALSTPTYFCKRNICLITKNWLSLFLYSTSVKPFTRQVLRAVNSRVYFLPYAVNEQMTLSRC